ncbi:MAG: hypothetical protein CL561_05310 [Alphaproteobacteria bacterium]|nr:hypothetical protein [Alphaproteobacteria bacterium]
MPHYILANMLNNIRLELQTHSRFISGKIVMQANRKEIIMNFSVPPSDDDILVLAKDTLENLPDEFSEFCKDIELAVEDFASEDVEQQLDAEDPYEILLFLKSGKEISPGIEAKNSADNDCLVLYRRPILDYWAEVEEDFSDVITRIIFEEIAAEHDYTADEIAEMVLSHLS